MPQTLADARWWDIDPVSAGVFGVPVGFAVMVIVSLCTPRPAEAELQMLDSVRYPGGPNSA
jgi:cation/acetate symporter